MTTHVLTPNDLTGTRHASADTRCWVAVVGSLAVVAASVAGLLFAGPGDGGEGPTLAPVSRHEVLAQFDGGQITPAGPTGPSTAFTP